MERLTEMNPRQRLVYHVQELERVELLKQRAAECVRESFEAAKRDGYDAATLKVVLKLRKMTPDQRRDRRALEAIYLAALGMLEGEALPDEARRRLDRPSPTPPSPQPAPRKSDGPAADRQEKPVSPEPASQPALVLKDPDEARREGGVAAAAGKRVYDNPYPAGDPCRAAWDEGWCAQQKSHGMETPAAYQRRTKPPEKDDKDGKPGEAGDQDQRGAA